MATYNEKSVSVKLIKTIMRKPAFVKTGEEYEAISRKLRKQCLNYLKKQIKEHGDIDIDIEASDGLCMTYDGGNHPEYNSNAFSLVQGVSLNDKGIVCFSCEDEDNILECRVDTQDIYGIASYVAWNN